MRSLMVLLVAASLAGCVGSEAGTDDASVDEPDVQFSEDRGRGNITVDAPRLPVEAPAPGERGLAEPPVLRLGEWWTISITDHFTYETIEVTRVVAGTERGDYLIGFPLEAFSNDALILHTPGFGDVLTDLSYSAHDIPYVPLRFPLEEGDSWETAWESEGATMQMLVEEVREDGTVLVTGSPTGSGAYPTTIVYDPAIGEVRSQVMEGYSEWEVIDHGYGFEGDVRVPHAHDLVFLNGRIAGAVDVGEALVPPTLAPPTETITVGEGYDRVSFAALFFDVAAQQAESQAGTAAAAGYYSVKATAPDGTVFEDTYTPADGGWFKATFYGHEDPAGDWELEAVAGGPGAAFLEGIGYHSIDIELPSGCVLASAAAGHHGTLCRDERVSEGLAQ